MDSGNLNTVLLKDIHILQSPLLHGKNIFVCEWFPVDIYNMYCLKIPLVPMICCYCTFLSEHVGLTYTQWNGLKYYTSSLIGLVKDGVV